MINKYDDLQLELLIESIKKEETRLLLSDRFSNLLNHLSYYKNNNIATYILTKTNSDDFLTKITYIDIDDDSDDMVSFITVTKASELILKDNPNSNLDNLVFRNINRTNNDVYKKNRSKSKIGRFITRVFGDVFIASGKPGEDIETFVNLFKSLRKKGVFEEVKGEDIKYWYLGDRYVEGGGKLNNSCMRYESAQDYIDFYAKNENKVSLLILKDKKDSDKIRGRALIWKLSEPSGRTFMDRIYTTLDSDVESFKDYATKNKYLYKLNQSIDEYEDIVDPIDKSSKRIDLVVNDMLHGDEYPYMDTLKYYDINDKKLTNNEDLLTYFYKLENTDGTYESSDDDDDDHDGQIWVEYDGEWYDEDEVFCCDECYEYRHQNDEYYLEHYGELVCPECLESEYIECDYYIDYDEYRKSGDAIYLERYGEYATQEYLNSSRNEFVYIENSDQWIKLEDARWSEHYQEYIDEDDAIEVNLDEDGNETDWRIEGDGTYYEKDDEYYDNDVIFDDEDDEDDSNED